MSYIFDLNIMNTDCTPERMQSINWNVLAQNSTDFRGLMQNNDSKTMVPAIRRAMKARHAMPRTAACPVDVELLAADASVLEGSVQTRMDMLAEWLASQQTLSQEYVAVREERDELKRRLDMANARLKVQGEDYDKLGEKCRHFNERIQYFEEEYDCAFRNLSDVMLENAELMDEKNRLESELEQAKMSLDEKAQQLAKKKSSEREKVLQEQLDAANERMKEQQTELQTRLEEEAAKRRAKNINAFIDGLRSRCRNKDRRALGFLFDDLKDSSWGFPELQQAVRALAAELLDEPTTDERMARAQEKIAEKPATTTFINQDIHDNDTVNTK